MLNQPMPLPNWLPPGGLSENAAETLLIRVKWNYFNVYKFWKFTDYGQYNVFPFCYLGFTSGPINDLLRRKEWKRQKSDGFVR